MRIEITSGFVWVFLGFAMGVAFMAYKATILGWVR